MKFIFSRKKVLKNKIKSSFTVESTSCDEKNFTYKVNHIKNDQKIVFKCFTNTSDNPQGDAMKRT